MGYKAEKVLMELRRKGFDMTTKEFYGSSIEKVLKRYGIMETLTEKDMEELEERMLRLCIENELGLVYMEEDEWKDK